MKAQDLVQELDDQISRAQTAIDELEKLFADMDAGYGKGGLGGSKTSPLPTHPQPEDDSQLSVHRQRHKAETLQKERQQAYRERVKESGKTTQRDLFVSSVGMQELSTPRDRYRQTHQGEFDDYSNRQAMDIALLSKDEPGTGSTLTDKDGNVITTVKTTRLSPDERDKRVLTTDTGRLRREDGILMDTTDSTTLVSAGRTTTSREPWVLEKDGTLRAGSQLDLSENLDTFRAAQRKLLQDTGRVIPESVEEARQYGFPEDVTIAHHTTLSDGEDVLAAGEIEVTDGRVDRLSNASGHYLPDPSSTFRMVDTLDQKGIMSKTSTVEVFDEHGVKRSFSTEAVLAGGEDINRVRALQQQLDQRGQKDFAFLSKRQKKVRRKYQKPINRKVRSLKKKIDTRQRAVLAEITRLEDALKAATPDTAAALQAQLDAAHATLSTLTADIAKSRRTLKGRVDAMIAALLEAGVTKQQCDDIARQQKIGTFNEAELELRTWMRSLTSRRRELAELRGLMEQQDQKEKIETAQTLEAMLRSRPKRTNTPPDPKNDDRVEGKGNEKEDS